MPSRSDFQLFAPGPPLLLILLLATGLRLFLLGSQSLWYDEAVSLYIAQKPIPELVAHTAGDIHPPLYYILVHFWIALTGPSEFALRFLSLVFGVVLVSLAFRLARDWFGEIVGLLAAFLTAVSPYNLWYSQEARMYTLTACLALLSVMLVARLWERYMMSPGVRLLTKERYRVVSAYILAVTLGEYTHYYFVFLWLFLFLGVMLLLIVQFLRVRADPERQVMGTHFSAAIRDWLLIQLAAVALYLPWLPVVARQALEPPVPPWRSFVPVLSAAGETLNALVLGQAHAAQTAWPLVLVVLVLYLIGMAGYAHDSRRTAVETGGLRTPYFLACATLIPSAFLLVVSIVTPLYHVRYMFIFAPAFYIVLALGLFYVGQRSLILTVVLAGIYGGASGHVEFLRHTDPAYAKDDYRSAVRFIADRVRPGDAILIHAGYIYPAFVYYFEQPVHWRGRLTEYRGDQPMTALIVAQTGTIGAPRSLGWGHPTSDFFATDEATTAAALERLLARHSRLWVLRANDTVNDQSGFVRRYLTENAVQFEVIAVAGESFVQTQGFLSRSAASVTPAQAVGAVIGQKAALLGWTGPMTVTSGTSIKLSLFWQQQTPMDSDYHVSLGLFDGRGRQWAIADGPPIGSLLPTSKWISGFLLQDAWTLPIPRGTPPGDYGLQVALYDPRSGKVLPVPGGTDGVRARLGRIQVFKPVHGEPGEPIHAVGRTLPVWGSPSFQSGISLSAYGLYPDRVRPGDVINAEFMWLAQGTPLDDHIVFLQLIDERGRLVAARESPPVDGRYPTTQWTDGEYIRDPHQLLVPANLADGRYRVIAGLLLKRNRERVTVRQGWLPVGGDSLDLAGVEVRGRERVMQPPASIGTPLRVLFGDGAQLLGYDLRQQATQAGPQATARRSLNLILFWQAVAPMNTAYKVFVHLVGTDQQILAQRDSEPGSGSLPTTGWLVGEFLTDSYTIDLSPSLAAGPYSLYVGLYDPQTGVRLTAYDTLGKPIGDYLAMHNVVVR